MINRIFVVIAVLLFSLGSYAEERVVANKIHIGVCSLLSFSSISEKLDSDRYVIEIISVPDFVQSKSECEAIWIGIDVPLVNAKEVIMSSIDSGIKLRYIGIPGDYNSKRPPDVISRTITIGASTKAAINQGLKKLDDNELMNILSAETEEQLHENIRNTYSVISKRNWIHRLRE